MLLSLPASKRCAGRFFFFLEAGGFAVVVIGDWGGVVRHCVSLELRMCGSIEVDSEGGDGLVCGRETRGFCFADRLSFFEKKMWAKVDVVSKLRRSE